MAAVEFARLELRQEVRIAGGTSSELVIYRPTCKDLMGIADIDKPADQVRQFVNRCVRAVNGGDTVEFKANELDAADAAELSQCAGSFYAAVREFELPEDTGDGVTEPLFYTLQRPIRLNRGPDDPDPITIKQIEFQARRLGEISEFLDTRAGSAEEFMVFMRTFGKFVGVTLPVTEVVFDAMDYIDYLIIRAKIMGKLVRFQNRWRKTLTLSPSNTDGLPALGTT